MTTRQKQFVYHYLRGLPAAKAAISAGYARSTAERNAAAILKTPAIAAKICRIQAYEQTEFKDLYQQAKQFYYHTHTSPDATVKEKGLASQQMIAWQKLKLKQSALAAEILNEPTDEEPQDTPIESAPAPVGPSIKPPTQPPKSQQKSQSKNINKTATLPLAKETDTLPNGQPAFDIQLSPQKPTPPPPQKQVIEVRNYIPKTLHPTP